MADAHTGPSHNVIRSVIPLFAGLVLLMVATGLVGSLVGIRAELEGFPTLAIGAVMAMYYGGFLVGSLLIPGRLASVGHIRVFSGLSATAAAAALTYPLFPNVVVWGLLRFAAGLAMAGVYIAVESWLNARASNETRGRLLGTYALVVTLGLGLGQTLLGAGDPEGFELFTLVGILITVAVVPVALFRLPEPEQRIPSTVSLGGLVQFAPLGVLGVAVAGAAGGSIYALGAVYGTRVGLTHAQVGAFMALSLVVAAGSQYPLGALSDRFPRRRVILAVSVGAAATACTAAWLAPTGAGLFTAAAIYGALTFPMYSLSVSHINDAAPAHQLVSVAAGIMFVYGVGSVVGPLVTAGLMVILGPSGYFWSLGAMFIPTIAYAIVRIVSKARPPQERFIGLPPRSSPAVALLADEAGDRPPRADAGAHVDG